MYSNPFVSQLVAKEQVEDTLRQAEKARLVRIVESPGRSWQWLSDTVLALKNWRPRFDSKRVPAPKIKSLPR
jgi:hypothetical protein